MSDALVILPAEILHTMQLSMDYEAFGVAVHIASLQITSPPGLYDTPDVHKKLNIHKAKWKRIKPLLLSQFVISPKGYWIHPHLKKRRITQKIHSHYVIDPGREVSTPSSAPDNDPGTMVEGTMVENKTSLQGQGRDKEKYTTSFIGVTKILGDVNGPAGRLLQGASAKKTRIALFKNAAPTDHMPRNMVRVDQIEARTIDEQLIIQGVKLFEQSGTPENQARKVMGKMLKEYEMGAVATVLGQTLRAGDKISNPIGWMTAALKTNHKKKGTAAYGRRTVDSDLGAKPETDAAYLGVSKTAEQKIHEHAKHLDASRKFNFKNKKTKAK